MNKIILKGFLSLVLTSSFAKAGQESVASDCHILTRTQIMKSINETENLLLNKYMTGASQAITNAYMAGAMAYGAKVSAHRKGMSTSFGAMAIIFAASGSGTVVNDVRIITSARQYLSSLKEYLKTTKDIDLCQDQSANPSLEQRLENIKQMRLLVQSQILNLNSSLEVAAQNKETLALVGLSSLALFGFYKAETISKTNLSNAAGAAGMVASALAGVTSAYSSVKLYLTANEISKMKNELVQSLADLKLQEDTIRLVIESNQIN